jgi:hypothetical protein
MKRIFTLLLFAVLITGIVSAQGIRDRQKDGKLGTRNERQRGNNSPAKNNRQNRDGIKAEIKSLSVEGTLKLEKGFIAVESGDTVYLVPMLTRYIGFIEGLKEGAKVSVEGLGFRQMIMPKKITLGEKTYDFPANIMGNRSRNNIHGQGRSNFFHSQGNKHGRNSLGFQKFNHNKKRSGRPGQQGGGRQGRGSRPVTD